MGDLEGCEFGRWEPALGGRVVSAGARARERHALAVDDSEHVRSGTYARDMSMDAWEVEQALLALDQGDVDAAWCTGLRRRIDDIDSGKVQLLDVNESHGQLRAELAARRV
jgi:hypothetical protein